MRKPLTYLEARCSCGRRNGVWQDPADSDYWRFDCGCGRSWALRSQLIVGIEEDDR